MRKLCGAPLPFGFAPFSRSPLASGLLLLQSLIDLGAFGVGTVTLCVGVFLAFACERLCERQMEGQLAASDEPISMRAGSMARRGFATFADQCLSSLQNYVVLFMGLHALGTVALGEFALCYTTMPILLAVIRGLVMEPLTIRFATSPQVSRKRAGADATGLSIALGLFVFGVCSSGSLAIPNGRVRDLVFGFGVICPTMLLQDAWRFYLIASGRPARAAVNDGLCFVFTGALAVAFYQHVNGRPVVPILVWGAGTAIGAIAGIAQTRVVPRIFGALSWLRATSDLGPRLAVSRVAESATSQLGYYLVAVVASIDAVGELGAAIGLMAPVTTLVSSISIFAVPEAVRYRGQRQQASFVVLLSSGLFIVVIASAGVLYLLPHEVGHLLAGRSLVDARRLLLPVAIWTALSAAKQGPAVALRANGQMREVLNVAIVAGVFLMLGATGGGYADGSSGAAWGFALGALLGAIFAWSVYLRAKSRAGTL
jgi:O-antigen/teichoic acid export membrane protein